MGPAAWRSGPEQGSAPNLRLRITPQDVRAQGTDSRMASSCVIGRQGCKRCVVTGCARCQSQCAVDHVGHAHARVAQNSLTESRTRGTSAALWVGSGVGVLMSLCGALPQTACRKPYLLDRQTQLRSALELVSVQGSLPLGSPSPGSLLLGLAWVLMWEHLQVLLHTVTSGRDHTGSTIRFVPQAGSRTLTAPAARRRSPPPVHVPDS